MTRRNDVRNLRNDNNQSKRTQLKTCPYTHNRPEEKNLERDRDGGEGDAAETDKECWEAAAEAESVVSVSTNASFSETSLFPLRPDQPHRQRPRRPASLSTVSTIYLLSFSYLILQFNISFNSIQFEGTRTLASLSMASTTKEACSVLAISSPLGLPKPFLKSLLTGKL